MGALVSFLLIGAFAIQSAEPTPSPMPVLLPAAELVQSGDLIFRQGTDLVSVGIRALQSQGEMTHVGVVVIDAQGVVSVIHAYPAEKPGDVDGVQETFLTAFLAPTAASRYSVLRYPMSTEVRTKVVMDARSMVAAGIPFDSELSLDSTDKLYCTELIWRLFQAQGLPLGVSPERRGPSFIGHDVLMPGSLERSAVLTRIVEGDGKLEPSRVKPSLTGLFFGE